MPSAYKSSLTLDVPYDGCMVHMGGTQQDKSFHSSVNSIKSPSSVIAESQIIKDELDLYVELDQEMHWPSRSFSPMR